MTKGLSRLGFSADVFLKKFDDSRYVQSLRNEFRDQDQRQQAPGPAPTQAPRQQYQAPAQQPAPVQFKKKEDTASIIPMTEAQAGKIMALCAKAEIDSQTLGVTIKAKFNHGWKHLSQSEANQLIAELENFGGAA